MARHYAGLPKLLDVEEVRVPRGGALRAVRRVAGWVPFHRVFHSVELSLLHAAAISEAPTKSVRKRVLEKFITASSVIGLCRPSRAKGHLRTSIP